MLLKQYESWILLSSNPSSSASSGHNQHPLDAIDVRILAELRDNGRLSMAALAERLNISRASAYSRVDRLTATGVIVGFTAQVNPRLVGLDVCALVFVTIHPRRWETFHKAVLSIPDVEYCVITTGEHDAMMIIREPDLGSVHHFVTSEIAIRPEVRAVVSVVVLDEVVRRPYVLPTDLPDREHAGGELGMTRWTPAATGRSQMSSS